MDDAAQSMARLGKAVMLAIWCHHRHQFFPANLWAVTAMVGRFTEDDDLAEAMVSARPAWGGFATPMTDRHDGMA